MQVNAIPGGLVFTVIGGVQMCVSDGACASGECQVWLEVHVHGVHHSSRG